MDFNNHHGAALALVPGEDVSTRIHSVLAGGSMATAFQPIYDLATGQVAGAEALTRFAGGHAPDVWFAEAAAARLSAAMELAAIDAALSAAAKLPEHLYVSVNASPQTCLGRRFQRLLLRSPIRADRIVLELTEHSPVEDYAPLISALDPLRMSGVRIAVDDAGAGYASMRHVVRLAPDIIKLDKGLIAGIDANHLQKALGRAMVNFSRDVGATITAEGIETSSQLATVTGLGITSGQGFFLGRPTLRPDQWAQWQAKPVPGSQSTNQRDRRPYAMAPLHQSIG